MTVFITSYVMVCCMLWLMIYGYLIWSHARLPLFKEQVAKLPPLSEPWPIVSVIIPACNEAEHLEPALRSLLAQDYPALELIVVNDRSSDATGTILDALARHDARIRAVHIDTLPAGWLGKVHAQHRGVQQASGEWLLFIDADVQFAPAAVRQALTYVQQHHLDHLALLPGMILSGFWLDVCVQAFAQLFLLSTRAVEVNQPHARRYIGVGAFNLVRAAMLQRTPGLAWLRLEPADDMGLGLMLHRAGAVSHFAIAIEDLSVPWYPSVGAMFRGLEKNLFGPGAQYQWWRLLLQVAGLWLLLGAPLLGLWYGVSHVAWLCLVAAVGVIGIQLLFAFMCTYARRSESLRLLLLPLGLLVITFMMLRAGYKCLRHGGIDWRGTHYPLAQLRQGQRVKF